VGNQRPHRRSENVSVAEEYECYRLRRHGGRTKERSNRSPGQCFDVRGDDKMRSKSDVGGLVFSCPGTRMHRLVSPNGVNIKVRVLAYGQGCCRRENGADLEFRWTTWVSLSECG
jgi:hypothetical protein